MNRMKQETALLFILCTVFLAACGNHAGTEAVNTASLWPSHAPDASPYVRVQGEESPYPPEETTPGEPITFEDIYTTEGNLYAKIWEMEMFREDLPQDEPYPFVIHTNAMLQGADTADDHIALAQKFVDLGCEAKVKEMRSVEDGKEYLAWVTIITTTPSHLWELSDSLDERLHVEQLYESVDIRFDTVIWPEE